jgi:hypothetical protein
VPCTLILCDDYCILRGKHTAKKWNANKFECFAKKKEKYLQRKNSWREKIRFINQQFKALWSFNLLCVYENINIVSKIIV